MSGPDPLLPSAHGALGPSVATGVRRLAERAAAADGVAALSEASLIGLDHGDSSHVLLTNAGTPAPVLGYAQVWVDGSCELVVDPDERRKGRGTELHEAAKEAGAQRFWAHGDLSPAAAAAHAWQLTRTRELRRMERELTDADAAEANLPEGYVVRTFTPGRDEDAWLRTNARAFVDHPEQGRVGAADLAALLEQDWFDPRGFFVVEHAEDGDHPGERGIAAFHWTKVPTGQERRDAERSGVGEVFVVGIDPDEQGRGLAGPLTRIGLSHLARRGLRTVELYVDGTNTRAVRTYERIGFRTAAVDVVYG